MTLTRVTSFGIALCLALTATTATAQTMDDMNGMWTVSLDNQNQPGRAMTESYHGHWIRLMPDGTPVELQRNGDVLTSKATGDTGGLTGGVGGGNGNNPNAAAPQVRLTITGFSTPDKADDKLTGTWFGKKAIFSRDLSPRGPIELDLARGIGDRPWVRFMREVLIPKSAEDRETYHRFDRQQGGRWIMATELGAKGYWITKGWLRNQATFDGVFASYHEVLNSPRSILSTRLGTLIGNAMRPDKKTKELGLALSSLGMYFSTGSGGSVRLIITSNRDSIVYYITDRRAHERTGLVVNATPTHAPLASSFGKWQNDAGEMTLADDEPYDRAVLELMVKSNTSSMNDVSRTGRSAFTDYMGIMAIEDQRGVMFGNNSLDWGRNMTEASFIISVIRALSHGELREKPAYRTAPEKTVQDEQLSLRASASGQLEPNRSVEPRSVRIQAAGLPVVLDDGDGTLYAEGTDPSNDSLGNFDYTDGSYNLSWTGFAREARMTYKDGAQASQTRPMRLTSSASVTLVEKIQPGTLRIKAPGFADVEDDKDGSLYDVGANHDTDDSRGYLDYDDGTVECSWAGVPTGAITATFKTTDGQDHTQTVEATIASEGLIDPLQVVPGSVKITSGNGLTLVDDGDGKLYFEDDAAKKSRGSVNYSSGTYRARWLGVPTEPIRAVFKYDTNKTKTVTIAMSDVTVSADGNFANKKVTPRSIHIKAEGLPEVVDDGDGTLHDVGTDPSDSDRGSIDYADGSYSLTWGGVPGGGKATVTYKSKAGEVVLTSQRELAMQVIVEDGGEDGGPTLQPGTPSYIDILNGAENALEGGRKGGDDCQVGSMSVLEDLTTQWLRAEHPAVIGRLETALAPFGYDADDSNLFTAMTVTFYDNANFGKCTTAQGNEIVEAGLAMFKTIRKDSRKLEAFILANGVTKSDAWAPRASGF